MPPYFKMIQPFFRSTTLAILLAGTTFGTQAQVTQQKPLEWANQMANSDIHRNPKGWMLDFSKEPRWGYCQGLVCTSLEKLWKRSGQDSYYAYIKEYADEMIQPDGTIKTYTAEDYNIDNVNAGKFVFALYEKTGEEKYKKALQSLRDQMKTHPKTSEGGFWHKKRYPHQMWLDGLYMASPFLAQYAQVFKEPALYDEVARQIILIDRHNKQPETGLYAHGWDESRQQKWSDPETGRSPHVWGRGLGWFAMTLVDVLEFFPKKHPKRDSIVAIATHVADMLMKYQDPKTGLWYQVMDVGPKEGNYGEASASTMLAYFLVKGVREGILPASYLATGRKGYEGVLQNLIRKDDNGDISIMNTCAGAGLGGNPYRSGTYEYYIQEAKRDNDPKSVGPFILLALEMDQTRRK